MQLPTLKPRRLGAPLLAACLFTPAVQEEFDATLRRAQEQLGAEQFVEALATLDAADAMRPGRPEVGYGRGIAFAELGRTDEAIRALEALVALDPTHANGWALLGRVLADRGDLAALLSATDAYENAIAYAPGDPRVALALMRTYGRLGMYSEALATFDTYGGAAGRLLRLERARMLVRDGRLQQARVELEAIVANGAGAQVQYELAGVIENLGDLDTANTTYATAVMQGPAFGQAWLGWGALLVKRQRYDEAVAKLDRARQLLPRNPEAHRLYGVALARTGERAAGVESLERALDLDPDEPRALRDMAAAIADTEPERARALAARAVDVEREISQRQLARNRDAELALLTARGLYHYRRERLDEAIGALQRAAELAPDDGLVQMNLGLALAASGNHEAALQALETAARLTPQRADVHLALERSYRRLGREEEADAAKRRAAELTSGGARW